MSIELAWWQVLVLLSCLGLAFTCLCLALGGVEVSIRIGTNRSEDDRDDEEDEDDDDPLQPLYDNEGWMAESGRRA